LTRNNKFNGNRPLKATFAEKTATDARHKKGNTQIEKQARCTSERR
jgi:hypothetical protein